jgi:hypothetical protein
MTSPATVAAMNIAFAVAAVVAVIAIVTFVLFARKAAEQLARERRRAEQLDEQLRSTQDALTEAEARGQTAKASSDLPDEGQRPGPDPAAVANDGAGFATALWELERLRLEREWAEVAGTPAPTPVPWDRGLRAAIAVELEIIREVIGTPSQLEPAVQSEDTNPETALAATLLATEVLRRLAHVGDEMMVSVSADADVSVAVTTVLADAEPDLSRLTAAAAALGGELTLSSNSGELKTHLRLPARETGRT